jgi:hypothetical protein
MDAADIVIIGAGAGAKLVWGSVPGRPSMPPEGRVETRRPAAQPVPDSAGIDKPSGSVERSGSVRPETSSGPRGRRPRAKATRPASSIGAGGRLLG